MTILHEREQVIHIEHTQYPGQVSYVRYLDKVGVGNYETTHAKLAVKDGLYDKSKGTGKPVISDGGILDILGDVWSITAYRSGSTIPEQALLPHNSAIELAESLKNERRKSGQLIATLANHPITLYFDDGSEEIVNP